ncbi:MAG: hypothetical protein PHN55_15145 [Dysgonamonadaceae bacterium]|nr:hypothetical protein [Dysgonamonadaceae bacterium]
MKEFTIEEIKDLLNQVMKEKISFFEMVEVINEKISEAEVGEFKDGDFVAGLGCLIILHKQINNYSAKYHVLYAKTNGRLHYYNTYSQLSGTHKLRLATETEKQELLDALIKEGKRWNAEKLCVEYIEKDISEIATDFKSAVDYLHEDIYQFTTGATKNHSFKLSAFNRLMILAEAWNSFDEFKPDWEDTNQCKHYPLFEFVNGKFEFSNVIFSRSISDTHMSNFSFKTPERAEQFGKQFIDLFRIVLSN